MFKYKVVSKSLVQVKVRGDKEEIERDLDLIRSLPVEHREYNDWRREWNITNPWRVAHLLPGLETALREFDLQLEFPIYGTEEQVTNAPGDWDHSAPDAGKAYW